MIIAATDRSDSSIGLMYFGIFLFNSASDASTHNFTLNPFFLE